MSVQKNFVIKNGLEVNNDLIFADKTLNKVGIGTTVVSNKLEVVGGVGVDNISVSGISTVNNIQILGQLLTSQNTGGNYGDILISTGVGITWSSYNAFRSKLSATATSGQTVFNLVYNVGYLDVFVNGVRLTDSEFTATDGYTITLANACFGGESIEIVSYNAAISGITTGSGGGGGLAAVTILQDDSVVGLAETINFAGPGISTITVSAGIATITIPGTTRSYSYYVSTLNQTSFIANYDVSNVEVFLNGSKLSELSYIANDGINITLNEPTSDGDEVEIISYLTYNITSSSANYADFSNASNYSNYAYNLIGFPDITVGSINASGTVSAISYYGDGSNLTGVTGVTNLVDLLDVDATTVGDNKYLKYNIISGKFEFVELSLESITIDIDGGTASTAYEPLETIVGDGGNASTIFSPTDLTFGGGGA